MAWLNWSPFWNINIQGFPAVVDIAITNLTDLPRTISCESFLHCVGWLSSVCLSDPLLLLPCPDWWLEAALCRLYWWAPYPLASVGSGNAGWKVESESRVAGSPAFSLRVLAPGHVLQIAGSLLLFHSSHAITSPGILLYSSPFLPAANTYVSFLLIKLMNCPNRSVPSALCWDHNWYKQAFGPQR